MDGHFDEITRLAGRGVHRSGEIITQWCRAPVVGDVDTRPAKSQEGSV
jgi:hypothetical protein